MAGHLTLRRYIRVGLLTVIVFSALGGVLWFQHLDRPEGTEEIPSELPHIESDAQMVTRDFRHVETRMNRIMWVLEASIAEIFVDHAKLQNVKITYHGDRDQPLIITGQKGRFGLRWRDAILTGNVRVDRGDGSYLITQELRWKNQSRLLKAPQAVTIKSRDLDINGGSMVVDIDKEWIKVSGEVTTVLRPEVDYFKPAS